MSTHVTAELAAHYVDHELPEPEARALEEHLDTCDACREVISALAKARWSVSGEEEGELSPVLPRGTVIGQFEIDRPLDAGGMGMIYVARDLRLERDVAIKAILNVKGDPAQLLAEARAMARVAHPNVVAVYDVVELDASVYLAMELVTGVTLRRWLDQKRSWRAVLDAFIAAGAGLAAAHAANVVHGDIKPANILVGNDGRVRITDFGLATSSEASRSGEFRGTPAYMSPEQREGAPCDARADQYALCASLYAAIFDALPDEPNPRRVRVPRSLRRALARGLARDPAARFPSLTDLLRALRSAASQRRRTIALGAVAIAVVAAATFFLGVHRREAAQCDVLTAPLVSPWNESTRYAVRRSFQATKLNFVGGILDRVESNLDRWSKQLDEMREAVCSDIEPAQRTPLAACLEERAREGRAIIGLFQDTIDASTVMNAVAATEQLPPPTRCRDLVVVEAPPAAPSESRRAAADDLARAFALMASGKWQEALAVNRALVAAAGTSGDPHLEGAARISLGRNLVNLSSFDEAQTVLLDALKFAELAREDRLRVQVLVNLTTLEYRRGQYQAALVYYRIGLPAAVRVGDRYLETELFVVGGSSMLQLSRANEALPLFEQAVALRRALYGDESPRLAAAITALGNAYAMQGDLERAKREHVQALEITRNALGAMHPDVATMHGNIGSDELYGLKFESALVELREAARIYETAYGAVHRNVASALGELGTAQLEAGNAAEALASFERAASTWASVAPQHPSYSDALYGRYRARVATGATADVTDLEKALELAKGKPAFQRARIQFELGRTIGGERGAALVEAAIEGFASSPLPLPQRELALARDWEVAHDRGK
ncbi:MAG TPA: tetratricopeptide repeat protein [Kofleriaceae bacterium]|nr:tetratricopeptide repeat protein [Kofleriaceae bacterium]